MSELGNGVIVLSVNQVSELIRSCLIDALEELKRGDQKAAGYLTRKEACERLHVSMPTLSRHIKSGILPAAHFGNRILIAESDIETALKEKKK